MSQSSSTTDQTPPRIDWKKKLEEHFDKATRRVTVVHALGEAGVHAALAQAAATALLAEAVERAVGAQLQGLGSFFAGSSLSEKLAKTMATTPTDAEDNQFFGKRKCSCGKTIQAGAPLCHSVK